MLDPPAHQLVAPLADQVEKVKNRVPIRPGQPHGRPNRHPFDKVVQADQSLFQVDPHVTQQTGRTDGERLAAGQALVTLVAVTVAAKLAGFGLTGRAQHGSHSRNAINTLYTYSA